jgi:hypothetical protein
MSTYFHHLPKELLLIIVSKGNYRDMEGLFFLDAKTEDEPFNELDIDINTTELFKIKHPYLYKLLLKKHPDLLEELYYYDSYNEWSYIFGTYNNYKNEISDKLNYYSKNGILPKEVKINDIIDMMFERDFSYNIDKIFVILSDIINKNKKYQVIYQRILDKLKLYDINLNEKELYIFNLFIYFISKYDEYFGDYINDKGFDINTIDPIGFIDNITIVSNTIEFYINTFMDENTKIILDNLTTIYGYKNTISIKRLFGILMNIILKDTQSKGIHINQDVLEWYNKNISN